MSAVRNRDDTTASRRRELKSLGLGGFVDLVADVESQPTEPRRAQTPSLSRTPAPKPQDQTITLSNDELDRFEEQFLKGSEVLETAARERGRSVSFADAFKIAEPQQADAVGADRGRTENRFSAFIAEESVAPAGDEDETAERPRLEEAGGFDLGAFYDRIGLARDDTAALSRIMARDDAKRAATQNATDDLTRIEGLLEALEIDLAADGPAKVDHDATLEDAPSAEACDDAVAATPVDGAVSALSDGRMTLVLDPALTRALLAAADLSGGSERRSAAGNSARGSPRRMRQQRRQSGTRRRGAAGTRRAQPR